MKLVRYPIGSQSTMLKLITLLLRLFLIFKSLVKCSNTDQ